MHPPQPSIDNSVASRTCPRAFELYQHLNSRTDNKKRTLGLRNVWKAIEQQIAANSNDFRQTTIGRITETMGGPTTQTIRNRNGEDYRRLISLAADETKSHFKGRPVTPESDKLRFLSKIEDQGTRHLVSIIIQENKSLRNEVNLLKRQISNSAPPISLRQAADIKSLPTISSVKRSAIEEFISQRHFTAKGWHVNEFGAIVDHLGDEIAPVGLYALLSELIS